MQPQYYCSTVTFRDHFVFRALSLFSIFLSLQTLPVILASLGDEFSILQHRTSRFSEHIPGLRTMNTLFSFFSDVKVCGTAARKLKAYNQPG
jgi:hypothetical protein